MYIWPLDDSLMSLCHFHIRVYWSLRRCSTDVFNHLLFIKKCIWSFHMLEYPHCQKGTKMRDSLPLYCVSKYNWLKWSNFSDRLLSVVCLSENFHILFFSRTTVPISTKYGTEHPQVKGIKVWSNEGPCPLKMTK